ncbi:MAG TPA: hypothetical protein PKL83_02560 [bacterium]|nr:hypothetical protein [bacterium]
MDILVHSLIGAAATRGKLANRKLVILAVIMSILPDLLGTIPWMYFRRIRMLPIEEIPAWSSQLYHLTHNLWVPLAGAGILMIMVRRYVWLMLPYALHVIADLPYHGDVLGIRLFYFWPAQGYDGPFFVRETLPLGEALGRVPVGILIEVLVAVMALFLLLGYRNSEQ